MTNYAVRRPASRAQIFKVGWQAIDYDPSNCQWVRNIYRSLLIRPKRVEKTDFQVCCCNGLITGMLRANSELTPFYGMTLSHGVENITHDDTEINEETR